LSVKPAVQSGCRYQTTALDKTKNIFGKFHILHHGFLAQKCNSGGNAGLNDVTMTRSRRKIEDCIKTGFERSSKLQVVITPG
jgi:hypothetical protein